MKDTDIVGIERFLDEMKVDVEEDKLDAVETRRFWLLSEAITVDKNLFIVEAIIGVFIGRFGRIVEVLEPTNESGIIEEKKAKKLLQRAREAVTDVITLSKDYLRYGDTVKFLNAVAHVYYTLQEVTETLRLEVEM
ncbi:MAG: hypothetical protein JJE19_00905 [Methanosarcinales archaeon]|nr:hypothetical protein [Methanosarcinales archaeon]